MAEFDKAIYEHTEPAKKRLRGNKKFKTSRKAGISIVRKLQ